MSKPDIRDLSLSVLTSLTQGILIISEDGKIVYSNPALQEMFGYAEDELAGQSIEMLVPDSVAEKHVSLRGKYFLALSRRQMGGNSVLFGKQKGGKEFPIEVGLSHEAVDGEHYACATVIDISSRWIHNKELEIHRKNLEKLVSERTTDLSIALRTAEANAKFLSEMLETMSHEFRTPLNAIIGFSDILKIMYSGSNDAKDADKARYVDMVHEAGQDLLALVKKATSMSIVKIGDLQAAPEVLLVPKVVDDAYDNVSRHFDHNKTRLDISALDDCRVTADPAMLRRVIGLILENAAKYAGTGAEVTVTCAESDYGTVQLVIEDNGPGIDQADSKDAFRAFERLGASGGTISGIGLGLTIAEAYMKSMNGGLAIESREGGGARIVLSLPSA